MAVKILRTGRLGTVNQVQAVNNVPYGGVYFGQWYRDYEKTGGLWLQKATHDLDYVSCLMEASVSNTPVRPVSVAAMHSRTVYGGNLDPKLRCSACDATDVCQESPKNLTIRGSDGGMLDGKTPTPESDHACAFSKSIMNQDAGSALIMYSNGAHASYVQNFLPRLSAGYRGATVIGHDATMRFDWQTDTVSVIDHHVDNVERIALEANGMHGGGDEALARNFIGVVRGREASLSPLRHGISSAAICLAARDAANEGVNQAIPDLAGSSGEVNLAPRGPVEPSSPATQLKLRQFSIQ